MPEPEKKEPENTAPNCPAWIRFLNETIGDQASIKIFQENICKLVVKHGD